LLQATDGVDRVLDVNQQAMEGLAHARSGELVAIAASNAWFAYSYWLDDSRAPDFASCVAIHDKPGHDPAEMFLGKGGKPHAIRRLLQTKLGMRVPFDVISLDASQICGSHGRITDADDQRPILLTDWQHHSPDTIPMTAIKQLVLDHLIQATGNDRHVKSMIK